MKIRYRIWQITTMGDSFKSLIGSEAMIWDAAIGLEKILGERVDITEYLDFSFLDRVWFWNDSGK